MGKNLPFVILPAMVMAIPMVVLHELAHLAAVRARGLVPIQIQIGAGNIVWKGKISGVDVSICSFPLAGLVSYLPRPGHRARRDRLIVVSAGPMANLAIAALAVAWPGSRLGSADGITFSDIVFFSNLFLAIQCLWPSASGPYPTDGWQILQLLRGKDPWEANFAAKVPTCGLDALRAAGKKRRRYWLALLSLAGLAAAWWCFGSWWINPNQFPILPVHVLASTLVVFVCVWFMKAEDVMTIAERQAKSPRQQAQHLFQKSLQSKIQKDWMKDLDKDLLAAMGRATQGISREWEIPLREAFQANPDHLVVGLFLYDCLSDADKFEEAIRLMEDLQTRFAFDGPAADYLGGFETAHRLCLQETSHPAVQNPESWLNGLDDSAKCHHLACVAGTVLSLSGLSALNPQAIAWCDSALDIYPYDFHFLVLKAALLMDSGNHEEAGKLLHQPSKMPPGTREANFALAVRALLASKLSLPSAGSLLKRALKQNLSPWMTRRLAEALQRS